MRGVTLYFTSMERPLTDRLAKDWFSDPTSNALAVANTGPVSFTGPIAYGAQGEDILVERRSLFAKNVRIRRVYDQERHVLVYVAYSTRWSSAKDDMQDPNARYKTSVAVVPLHR